MKKLRLKTEEWEEMIKNISEKFHNASKMGVSNFKYDQTDVNAFIKTLPEQEIVKPTIKINVDTYTRMYELVKQSSIELQWHLLVKRDLETQTYTVYDLLLFPQTNTGTSTTSDQNEFAKWITKLMMDPEFPFEDLRGHGHSHVNMNVYSSGIDDAYQRDLITKVEDGDFYIFLVLNKKMEMYALVYDFHQQMIFDNDDITIEIIDKEEENIKEWCKEQIEKYCKQNARPAKVTYTYSPTTQSYPGEDDTIDAYILDSMRRSFGKRR